MPATAVHAVRDNEHLMDYVEAPEHYEPRPGDQPSIFLAGGITACEDWQDRPAACAATNRSSCSTPRRTVFDVACSDNAVQRVAWEYRHLAMAAVTLFWFPRRDSRLTVQPITLYELGYAAEARAFGRRFVTGADPQYPRRLDVELQIRNALPDVVVYRDLDRAVAAALKAAHCTHNRTAGSRHV